MASDIPPLKSGGNQDKREVGKVGKLGEHTVVHQVSKPGSMPQVPIQKLFAGGDFKHQASLAWKKGFGVLIQLILHKLFGFAAPDLSLSTSQAAPKLYGLQSEERDSAKVKAVMDQIFPNIENFGKEWKLLPAGEREQFYKELEQAFQHIQQSDGKNIPHFEEEKQARFDQLQALKHEVKGVILVDLKKEFEGIKRGQFVAKPTLVFNFYKKIEGVEKNIGNLVDLKENVEKTFSDALEQRVKEFTKGVKLDPQALAPKERELVTITEAYDTKTTELRPKEKMIREVEEGLKALRGRDFDREFASKKQEKLETLARDMTTAETAKKEASRKLETLLEEEANLIKLRDSTFSYFTFSDTDKARLAAIDSEITEARTELKEKMALYTQLSSTPYKDKMVQNLAAEYQALKDKLVVREAEFKTQNPEKVKLAEEVRVLKAKREALEQEIVEMRAIVNQHVESRKQEIEPLARLMVAKLIFEKFQSAETTDKENSTRYWQAFVTQNRLEIRGYVESQFIKLYGFINPTLKQELDTAFNKLMIV